MCSEQEAVGANTVSASDVERVNELFEKNSKHSKKVDADALAKVRQCPPLILSAGCDAKSQCMNVAAVAGCVFGFLSVAPCDASDPFESQFSYDLRLTTICLHISTIGAF